MVSLVKFSELIVIFDTNMLIVPAQFGIDIFTQIKQELSLNVMFVTIKSVEKELERLSNSSSKYKKIVDLTKRIMQKENVVVLSGPNMFFGPVDDELVQFALETKGIVATNDKELRMKLNKKEIKCIFLRSKKFIELE